MIIWRQPISDYLELTKPRLSALVLATTGAGFWLGMRQPQRLLSLIPTMLGTALIVGGANALNQWSERSLDALMHRTKHRPLPTGRLDPVAACRFGIALSLAGVMLLALAVNWLSALLAAVSWASYVLVYTPLKRRTPLCTLVGAIPGALPPMIGWAAARGALGLEAWTLLTIVFLWQLPHFLAIAWMYREDYARAGFLMLPVIEPDGRSTGRQAVLYAAALLPLSLVPTLIHMAGPAYFAGALALTLLFLGLTIKFARTRAVSDARRLFLGSIIYLPLLWILMIAGRT